MRKLGVPREKYGSNGNPDAPDLRASNIRQVAWFSSQVVFGRSLVSAVDSLTGLMKQTGCQARLQAKARANLLDAV
jgi:hypothetical protein